MTQKVAVTFAVGLTYLITPKRRRVVTGRLDPHYDPKGHSDLCGQFDLVDDPKGHGVIRGRRGLL